MRLHLAIPLLPGPVVRCLCCLTVALLQACQNGGPDSPFKRYLNQLDLALPGPVHGIETSAATPAPMADQLQLPVSASGIEGLDALQLSGCAVQANIRKRQTSLGLFAKPSQRLILELEYLRLVPACIGRLQADNTHALADKLEAARLKIQAQLPIRIFNATLGSDEYRAFWLKAPAVGGYPHSDTSATTAALEAINSLAQRWLGGDYRVHNLDLELSLSAIAGGEGGQALAAWARQIDWLAAADRVIAQQGLSTTVLCRERNDNAISHRRTELARSYFIDVIQPLTSDAKSYYQSVAAPVTALEKQLDRALAPRYRHWVTSRNQYTAALTRAPTLHLEHMEHLMQSSQTCHFHAANSVQ
ncbi:Uncharacterised protein [Halioglobus japonicus]|nr:Uncharacterised protein [Halioglobus japonicus]